MSEVLHRIDDSGCLPLKNWPRRARIMTAMNTTRAVSILLAMLLAIAGTPAMAREKQTCLPQLQQGWIRLLPGGMPMHAGFGRIDNRCPQPVTVVGAKSVSYGSVELHESRNIDGVHRMRQLKELRIAPKDAATLKPGGLHLMLMDPPKPVKAGTRIAIVFRLSDGREMLGEFIARKPD